MQSEAPDVMNLDEESPATKELYGIGAKETDDFGRQCLLARRFAEAGVRYIQVSTGYKWDQHKDLVDGHNKIARATDRPIPLHDTDLIARLRQIAGRYQPVMPTADDDRVVRLHRLTPRRA